MIKTNYDETRVSSYDELRVTINASDIQLRSRQAVKQDRKSEKEGNFQFFEIIKTLLKNMNTKMCQHCPKSISL